MLALFRHTASCCVAATVCALLATSASATPLKVFLLAGQSNMGGSVNVDAPSFPADQPTTLPDVLFTQNVNALLNSVYVEPLGPLQPRKISDDEDAPRRWSGQELTFAQTLLDAGETDLAIIKYARNGTSLAVSWEPGGDLRNAFYQFVDDSLAELTNLGHTYEIAGFIWVQGSADAGVPENAVAYEANLAEFVGDLESRYGETTTVINRYHPDTRTAFEEEIRASQRAAANTDPDLFITSNDDLSLNRDRVHFTDATELESGRRLATRWLTAQNLPGDYNGDGAVNAADFTMWRDYYERVNDPGPFTDLNGNGRLDAADYTIWRDGRDKFDPISLAVDGDGDGFIELEDDPYLIAAAAARASATPEPSAALLGLLACSLAATRRRS